MRRSRVQRRQLLQRWATDTAGGNHIPLLATSINYKKPMLITFGIFCCESKLLWGSRVSFSFLILPVQN